MKLSSLLVVSLSTSLTSLWIYWLSVVLSCYQCVSMEWRFQVVSVCVLLLLGGRFLQFSWADQNGNISNCLPLGGPALTNGFRFFSTFIPFYGIPAQTSDVRANYSTPCTLCTLTVALY